MASMLYVIPIDRVNQDFKIYREQVLNNREAVRALYLTQLVYTLLSFSFAEGTEISPKSVAVTNFSQVNWF